MGNFLVWVVWFAAAFACLASAVAVVTFTNPFYSALALIGNLGALAVLYLLLSAEFVAAAQILIYAGSVMVMFLFVIAYLGGRADAQWAGGPSWQAVAAVGAAAARGRPRQIQAAVVTYPRSSVSLSTSRSSRRLAIATINPRPTTTSEAATAITASAKI